MEKGLSSQQIVTEQLEIHMQTNLDTDLNQN